MKRSLILGISGQDGAYLAKALLDRGHEVFGTTREIRTSTYTNLRSLGLSKSVVLYTMDVTDPESVAAVLKNAKPDEVYNLSAQSSVGASFAMPFETVRSIIMSTAAIIEAARKQKSPPRLLFAGSGDMFGPVAIPSAEGSPLSPRSPYACAKSGAFLLSENAVSAFGLYSATAILFNHESPFRDARFFSRKVVSAAARIASGSSERLVLGDLSLVRDFGWAPEYAGAMALMLAAPGPRSLVIASGRSFPLSDFVDSAFSAAGLDYREHVDVDHSLFRPGDATHVLADPGLARETLGWQALHDLRDVARLMMEAELKDPRPLEKTP